jgi:hypothetical protein
MKRPIPKRWLEPFRISAELGALNYEVAFTPRLPRPTALIFIRWCCVGFIRQMD